MMFCFLDLETTGIDLINDFPIEIGAVLVDEKLNRIKDFHSYISPVGNYRISSSALEIHGKSIADINEAPSERQAINDFFLNLGSDYRFVAWNMTFDVAFFKLLCSRNGFSKNFNMINYRHIDVQSISFISQQLGILPNDINSFTSLCEFFNLRRSHHHSAFEDANLLFHAYKLLIEKLKRECIHQPV